ncbi:stimulator of interferon genes protein-like [Hydra vulgaris]|uniref:stimulator of interferon genes protein-like n=1 Tax=Hydra vulgaris TaxID=6087 RepID=UPI001F5FF38F|nr:stimulator of interferon genes protein-like [Hydra vulgaris]
MVFKLQHLMVFYLCTQQFLALYFRSWSNQLLNGLGLKHNNTGDELQILITQTDAVVFLVMKAVAGFDRGCLDHVSFVIFSNFLPMAISIDKEIPFLPFTVNATYMISSLIVMHLLKLKEPSIVQYSHSNEVENKHLAAGLAWGCYSTENVSNDFNIKFYCNCLEDIRSTGGVHDRSYKNSVYSIEPREPQKPKKYVIMEYATPLNNLYKMSKHREANFSDEDLECEIILFYKKLKSILDDDPNCIKHYKLILLSSASQKNIADVLYREINDEENFFNNNVNV